MASKTVYICDRCGGRAAEGDRTYIVTGREMTPAGSSEDTGEHVDLCPQCWRALANILIEPGRGAVVLNWIKKAKR